MKARILPGWGLGLAVAYDSLPRVRRGDEPVAKGGIGNKLARCRLPFGPGRHNRPPSRAAVPNHTESPNLPANPPLTAWSLEIQRLVQAGVDERVVLLYITNSAGLFNLDPDQIIYLKNAGVSSSVLNAMIWHDQKLVAGGPALASADTLPNILTPLPPPSGESIFTTVAEAEPDYLMAPDEDYYAPDQPPSAGPVRAPLRRQTQRSNRHSEAPYLRRALLVVRDYGTTGPQRPERQGRSIIQPSGCAAGATT